MEKPIVMRSLAFAGAFFPWARVMTGGWLLVAKFPIFA